MIFLSPQSKYKIKCVNFVNPVFFILTLEWSLVNKTDLIDLFLSGTYCHKTGTRPPSCITPRKPTIHSNKNFTKTRQFLHRNDLYGVMQSIACTEIDLVEYATCISIWCSSNTCNGLNVLRNRTTSMPESVLRYVCG